MGGGLRWGFTHHPVHHHCLPSLPTYPSTGGGHGLPCGLLCRLSADKATGDWEEVPGDPLSGEFSRGTELQPQWWVVDQTHNLNIVFFGGTTMCHASCIPSLSCLPFFPYMPIFIINMDCSTFTTCPISNRMLHNGFLMLVYHNVVIMQSMLVMWRVFRVTLSLSRSVRGDWREGHSLTHLQVSQT